MGGIGTELGGQERLGSEDSGAAVTWGPCRWLRCGGMRGEISPVRLGWGLCKWEVQVQSPASRDPWRIAQSHPQTVKAVVLGVAPKQKGEEGQE